MPERRVQRCEHERVFGSDPGRDGVPGHAVDVAVLGDVVGVLVVSAEGDPRRAEFLDQGQQRLQVPGHRGLADQDPHSGTEPVAPLLERQCLVVGADPGGGVGVQLLADDARRVSVGVRSAGEPELDQLALLSGDHAGEIHHLGQPEHAAAAQQALKVAFVESTPRGLETRGGDRRGRHEVDVERQLGAEVEQPVDAVGAEHVRDLVRVDHDRRRPERQDEPRELVEHQLRRLEVDVRVDEARHDVASARVQLLGPLVLPEPGDEAVDDRDVGFEPLAREDGEHAPAADDEVRRLVATCDRQSAREVHPATIPRRPPSFRLSGATQYACHRGCADPDHP